MKHLLWLPIIAAMLTAGIGVVAQEELNPYNLPGDSIDIKAREAGLAALGKVNDLRVKAKAALKKGDVARATQLFEQTIAVNPYLGDEARIALADIYTHAHKNPDVIRVLKPMIYPPPDSGSSLASDLRTRMLYVLAILEHSQWQEAATVYEQSFKGVSTSPDIQIRNGEVRWDLPYYTGGDHTLPEVHFNSEQPDYAGLRAQAHLILGTSPRLLANGVDDIPYMLDHLKQTLKNNRRSLDAMFASGYLLARMGRFSEAREAYMNTAKLAPKEAKPEIDAALKALKVLEDKKNTVQTNKTDE